MRSANLGGSSATLFCACWLLVLALGAITAGGFLAPQFAAAQDEEIVDEDASGADGCEDEPMEDVAGCDVAGCDAPSDAGTTSGESPAAPVKLNLLQWIYESLGIGYMAIFLLLSFTLVALFVMNLLTARRENVCPMHLVEGFEAHLNEKQYQEAYEMAKADESFLGQVLSAGLAKLSTGYAQAIEAMQEVGEEENMRLEHRLSYMALIGTISPMVGLFGTVHGMINAFSEIAFSPTTPPPQDLAQGISTALFTTLIGLGIAIPAIVFYNILRNRISRLVLEVGILSEGLMSRFQNVGTAKK